MSSIEVRRNDDESARDLMDRASKIQEKMFELHGPHANSNDISQWANAMIMVAGSLFGQLHEQGGIPEEMDEQIAVALLNNLLMGIDIGRTEVRKAKAH